MGLELRDFDLRARDVYLLPITVPACPNTQMVHTQAPKP